VATVDEELSGISSPLSAATEYSKLPRGEEVVFWKMHARQAWYSRNGEKAEATGTSVEG